MDSPKPKRRWFRFSLRTMFIAVTVICVWLAYAKNWIEQRHAFIASVSKRTRGHSRTYPDPKRWAPMGMSLLGEPCAWCVEITETGPDGLPRKDFWQDYYLAKKLFPEVDISIVYSNGDGTWANVSASYRYRELAK